MKENKRFYMILIYGSLFLYYFTKKKNENLSEFIEVYLISRGLWTKIEKNNFKLFNKQEFLLFLFELRFWVAYKPHVDHPETNSH